MGNQQATDAELGWLAGIIDGEGYLGMSVETENKYREGYQTRQHSIKVEIKVTNCDPEIVVKTAQVMQKLGVNPYIRQPAVVLKENHKVHYEASIKRMAPVKRVLEAVLPYLVGSKLERANIVLQFIQLRTDNPGVDNPAYADNAKGRRGPRTIKPYSEEELKLVDQCRALQSRKGASETTRANGAAILQQMKQRVADRIPRIAEPLKWFPFSKQPMEMERGIELDTTPFTEDEINKMLGINEDDQSHMI